jgi:Tol biopolymer transport system component
VKILDFGLARRADPSPGVESAITRDGSVLGTAQYMSPEQAAGRPLDHRSDQFSLGAILYEMAAGKRAFERDSVPQTLAAVIQEEPEPLRKRNPAIPEDLARIVERCLAKDPVGRFDSTKDLVRALELASVATTRAPVRRATGAWWAWAAAASLVAVGGAALVRHYSHPAAPAKADASLEVVPLTTYPGREGEPTFSPDGSQVAFSWDGGDEQNLDIYVKAIGAEPPLRLTSDPASDGSPAWSPDGTRIAFLRERSGGGSEVLVVPPVGGPERRLVEVEGRADEGLAWSPDGRSLAVVDRVTPQEPAGIFLLDLATGSKMRLTSPRAPTWDDQPAFSPDGATVAFLRPPLLGVFLVSARGGEPRMLTAEGNWRNRLAWSPDGQAVLLAAERFPGVGERPQQSTGGAPAALVWRVPVDGTPPRAVRGTTNAGDVAVSGAGRLAYSQETVDFDVWRVDLRPPGKAPEPPTRLIASTKIDTNPQFSPDGERVAFVSVRSGQAEVWIVDRDGRRPLQLTSVGRDGGVGAPRWSPDGRNIAFDFSPVGQAMVNIYVVDASGGAPRRVTRSSAVDATPSWSRDGRWIYFGSNRSGGWQVWKVPATGEEPGGARQVTRGGGFAAIESTDGRYLYFTKRLSGSHDPRNSIWRLPVAGGEEEVAVDSFRASSGSWDLTVDGIYFVDQLTPSSPGQWVVRFLPFAQRRSSVVARLARPPYPFGPAVSVSPDGRWMLSAQGEGTSDLMLVEGFE